MPPATVEALYRHLAKAIQSPDVRELFAKGGSEASGMPPAEMAREAKSLSDRWGAVIREVGVRLEP
jgi:tripartite-type tricarboxylate transporter receptor subunit TctC